MLLVSTLFGHESSGNRISSHIGNFNYFDNENLFLTPLFCAVDLGVQILQIECKCVGAR